IDVHSSGDVVKCVPQESAAECETTQLLLEIRRSLIGVCKLEAGGKAGRCYSSLEGLEGAKSIAGLVIVIRSIAGAPGKLGRGRRPPVRVKPTSGIIRIQARTVIGGRIVEVVTKAQFDHAGSVPAGVV